MKQHYIWIQMLVVVTCLGACSDPVASEPALPGEEFRRPVFFHDVDLELPARDTGMLEDRCEATAPWGQHSWGVEAATFRTSESEGGTIRRARVRVHEGTAEIFGREDEGRWGLVRLVQGDMWGGTNCMAVPWHKPEPLTLDAPLYLEFDVRIDDATMTTLFDSWVLIGVNVWVSAPAFPATGRDIHGRKPLVLDLMVFHDSNMIAVLDESHEDDAAYHYQESVATLSLGSWRHVGIDLSQRIAAALSRFSLESAATDAKIYQAEFVVEVHNAEASAQVRNLSFFAAGP